MKAPICRHACRALAEGALESGPQALFFRFHLWYCWYCWPYKRQLRALGDAAREVWGPRRDTRAVEDRVLAQLMRPPS
ncbi:MAG: hypothetical protein HYZ75_00045 [Elusimicrobia bacterium]|nr:hypothetical protein [Elusimicrobiota bacterium]